VPAEKKKSILAAFDYKGARAFLEKKEKALQRENRKLFNRATLDVNKMIDLTIKKYNPKRIYQWGSLLHPEEFDKLSDIDIAVEGLKSAKKFFDLYGDLERLTRFSLDLVEIEKMDPIYANSIRDYGKLVYERKKK
jgi:predicted nucleotidyltransferase